MRKDQDEARRAVHIAAVILQDDGMCRYEDAGKCRRAAPTDADCVKCIEGWLLKKARSEIGR